MNCWYLIPPIFANLHYIFHNKGNIRYEKIWPPSYLAVEKNLFLSLDSDGYALAIEKLRSRLYKFERIFSQQVDLKSALDSNDFL